MFWVECLCDSMQIKHWKLLCETAYVLIIRGDIIIFHILANLMGDGLEVLIIESIYISNASCEGVNRLFNHINEPH